MCLMLDAAYGDDNHGVDIVHIHMRAHLKHFDDCVRDRSQTAIIYYHLLCPPDGYFLPKIQKRISITVRCYTSTYIRYNLTTCSGHRKVSDVR